MHPARLNWFSALAFLTGLLCAVTPAQPQRSDLAPRSAASSAKRAGPASSGSLVPLVFTASSPLETLFERLSIADPASLVRAAGDDSNSGLGPDRATWIPSPAGERFAASIPPDHKGDTPCGLLVWTGVCDVPVDWQPVFVRHRLILVVTSASLGRRSTDFGRYTLPVDAVFNMKQRFRIDDQRVYVSGFSAGAQLAMILVKRYPEVFSGGLFLMGGHLTSVTNHGNDAGPWEATALPPSPGWLGDYDRRRREVKLVVMKGGADREWPPEEGRSDVEALKLDGFERVSYVEVPNWPHRPPSRVWFDKGVAALETKPARPPTTAPTADPHPGPAQAAQAQRLLVAAQVELESVSKPAKVWLDGRQQEMKASDAATRRARDRARQYLERTIADYPTTPAAREARRMLGDLLNPGASESAPARPNAEY